MDIRNACGSVLGERIYFVGREVDAADVHLAVRAAGHILDKKQ